MTNRLRAGVLLGAATVMLTAVGAHAERPGAREWTPRGTQSPLLNHNLPLFFRSSAGTSWVRVYNAGTSPCAPADTAGSNNGQTIERVFCFERTSGAGGDSTWPAVPAGQNTGSKHETWNHWSKYAPPVTPLSKWHITQSNPNVSTWNAWCGCDSIVGVVGFNNNDAACTDNGFWIYRKGYGDDWNYALELRADGAPNGSGSTIKFDVRYDSECNYDYLYVEYSTNTGTTWSPVRTAYPSGTLAQFNAVSGNPDAAHGGTGRACGDDFFDASDQFDPGGGNVPWYGNSIWVSNVTFPLPPNATGGMRVRWRAFSDGAWSDQDGRGDTDGLAAVDNVLLTITSGGTTATDTFETGTGSSLNGRTIATENIAGAVTWGAGGVLGNTYDGWHLEFDPKYANKGNTCSFSDDWMWAAKPATTAIPASGNGFDFFLVSPVIDCNGWSGGVSEYAEYLCLNSSTEDYANQQGRFYDAANGWTPWNDYDGFITFAGCEFWNVNSTDDVSQYLGTAIDSLQVGWELIDINKAGEFEWGKHGSVQYLIDNVSFGSFDGTATVFTARGIDIFTDTFSQSDPAHTPFLQNPEQGDWEGLSAAPPGQRAFANADSLNVEVNDFNGLTAANVDLFWRHDNGGSGTFGAFNKIDMSYAVPNPLSPTDEGTYRAIIGKDNGGTEDVFPPANNRKIWKPATTVQYYVKCVDDIASSSVFPNTADDATPVYFEFSVLPFSKLTPAGQKILLVDDVGGRGALDFENSSLFDPVGGAGFGDFDDPAIDTTENLIEGALALLFGGSETDPKYDKFDVGGAGSSVQCEPNTSANSSIGMGGLVSELGVPTYNVLIWPQLDLDAYSFADTTRIGLKTYIDFGGDLLTCGNNIAFHLGSGGNNADSTIGFLNDYFGTSFPNVTDDETLDRVLNMTGNAGTSLANVELGIYGECPLRFDFDRLTLTTAPATGSQASILATYTDGNASDNGRPSTILNRRRGIDGVFNTADDGTAVLFGFDFAALLSDASRACVIGRVLSTNMGITIPVANVPACVKNGVDAPVVNARFGFQLAQASPNPFAKSTSIRFSVASKEHVSVEVYNILGQKVRTLVNESLEANTYVRDWDGRSDAGERVSNGIYFYKMVAGDFSDTKKAVLLK